MRCIYHVEREYPLCLRDLRDPPAVIYARGVVDFESRPVLAVVGSRDCSTLSEAWMRRHLSTVSRFALIVSGGAAGVDDCAHRIALESRQPTAVVFPSGLDRLYPAYWSKVAESVWEHGGAFISELAPTQPMRRSHFEQRNRLIAAFADVVLIVEGQRRSGTAITARHAQELGRAVAVLPWFPGDPRGELGLELLSTGAAHPIRDANDILSLLSREATARLTRFLRV